MYMRRAGTPGISGQLYETKLISLLYFRAFHDHTIEDFQIAANVDNIGQSVDICFKFKADEFDKPVAVFIQAKHRGRGKIAKFERQKLADFFYSYCKIRRQFDPNNKDSFFNGTFDNTECIFVFYTNASIDPMMTIKHSVESGFTTKLYNLIGTGGTVKQLCKYEEIIEFLCKVTMKELMTTLANRIAKCIMIDNGNGKMLLTDEIVQRFHVILARQVFDVSEIQPDGYRIAAFRHRFFDTHEEYLTIFKDALFKQIIKIRKIPQLEQDYFSELTVHQVEELAVKELLLSFKVPSAFGNKDLTIISNNPKKRDRRIIYIASKIINLLDMCKPSKIVTIDESLGDGLLQLNGGIAGAIGNIFVLDDNTKLMKVTDNSEQLGPLANMLYIKLNSGIHNLHEYKFYFKDNKFAMLSFDCSNYEENFVKDFVNRLMFYCHQADEYEVEQILKSEIEYYQSNQPNSFQARTDAIFSNFHDKIQKWWMQSEGAPYLTREFDLESIKNIIKDPLMTSINLTYMSKMNQYNYTFTEDAVSSLNLLNHSSIIITENSVLTVVKVLQYLKNKDHFVLDFEYIAHLPTNHRNELFTELWSTDKKNILILVYDKTNSSHDMKHLEMFARVVRRKQTIVITNQTSFEIIHKYFSEMNNVIQDKKLSLIDLSVESQMRIIENASAMFPGVEMKLDLLLRGWRKTGSRFSCDILPRQQSDVDGASTSQETSATAAAADNETGTEGPLTRQTGEEENNVPGMSSDPLTAPWPAT